MTHPQFQDPDRTQQPMPGQPQPPMPPMAPQQPPKSKKRQKVVLIVFLLVVLGFIAAALYFSKDNGENAQVGNCVTESGSNSVKIVDCGDASATLKVVGRVENKTESEARGTACDAYPDAEQVFWTGKAGEAGMVLCLAKNGK